MTAREVVDLVTRLGSRLVQLLDEQPVLIEVTGVSEIGSGVQSARTAHVVRYVRRAKSVELTLHRPKEAKDVATWSCGVRVVCPADAFVSCPKLGLLFVRSCGVTVPADGLTLTVGRGEFG